MSHEVYGHTTVRHKSHCLMVVAFTLCSTLTMSSQEEKASSMAVNRYCWCECGVVYCVRGPLKLGLSTNMCPVCVLMCVWLSKALGRCASGSQVDWYFHWACAWRRGSPGDFPNRHPQGV